MGAIAGTGRQGREPATAAPPRLGPIAVLPVFLPLAGKRAVVAGGTPGAAWKAEMLAAAGARVEVFADAPSPELVALVAQGSSAGSLSLHARPWQPGDLAGAAFAVGDLDPGAAPAFAAAAQAAGVPVNVVDKPDLCTAQFGAVVNRSPLVIGISTAGAAPVLAQAVRRRIEALLPARVAAFAGAAVRLRGAVAERLAPGAPRRAFWERFAEAAFAGGAIPDPAEPATPARGKVTLVGAGPGDAELLTLKAVRALGSCDVILYDDLVADDVLELARREAERICVGKRGGRRSCRQEDITALMLRLAGEGRQLVRLKSGDPSVFGRAGEEIAALEAAGIEVEVVPGVTAASAMAAALKVSLTHRDHAQVLSLATGHSRLGELPDGVHAAIAGEGRTAVVYMGGRTAAALVARLLASGVAADTPAVAMWSVARPGAHRWAGPLAALPDAVSATVHDGPLLIGIGATFATVAVRADPPTLV